MFRLSVCADTVFLDLPFEQRVEKITEAGFHVEFWGWQGRDMDALAGNPDVQIGGIVSVGAGSMVHPEDADLLVESVAESIATARKIGCRDLILLAGVLGDNGEVIHRVEQHPITRWITAYKTLCRVAELAAKNEVTLSLEHLNTKLDHAGYSLPYVEDAVRLVDEVNSPNLKILLDIYHAQVQEGDIISLIRQYKDYIGYVHVADVPGRHQPGTGEIHYANVARALHEVGYDGTVGLEAFPEGDHLEAMNRFRTIFDARSAQ